jgi:hypothetical protein
MKVKFHRPRFARVSSGETENVEVLTARRFTPERGRPSQPIAFQERSFPLVVPIPKPEPFM